VPMGRWRKTKDATETQTETQTENDSGTGAEGRRGWRLRLGWQGRDLWIAALLVATLVGVVVTMILVGCSGSTEVNNYSAGAGPAGALASSDTITVVGEATVSGTPDEVVLSLTVESDGETPAAAMNKNSDAMAEVLRRLDREGVDGSDIETANVSVYPVRTYNPETGEERLTGYRAQNSITVTLANAEQVSKVLSAAVEEGVNIFSGPVWRLADDTETVAEALRNAIENARTKAEAMADAQGVELGDVITMSENRVQVPVYPLYTDAAIREQAAGSVVDTPISAASIDVTATVTVAYTLHH
jgi:uncharacterized protein YggE